MPKEQPEQAKSKTLSKTNIQATTPRPNLTQNTVGKIVKWHDDRGFGFIETEGLKEQIFFHVNDLPLNQGKFRPTQGETVLFTAKYDGKRWAATSVTSAKRQQMERVRERREEARVASLNYRANLSILVSIIWLALVAYQLPKLAATYLILSLILFFVYLKDKNAAKNNEWRVPEAHLHSLALVGGWSGGLIARYLFNHKTTKQEFVTTFWLTVIVNIAITIYFKEKIAQFISLI